MTRTNLVAANQSDSLRTTVPAHIVRQFKMRQGDGLEWEIMAEGGKLRIWVEPVRKKKGKR